MALPAAILPWIELRFFKAGGVPNSLGRLEFYVAGTSNHQDTFSNSTLTVANPNPMTLDANGRPTTPIYILPTGYKVVVSDSTPTELYEFDNVSDPSYTFFANLGQQLALGAKDITSGYLVTSDDSFLTVDEPSITPAIITLQKAADRGGILIVQNRSAAGVTAQLTPNGTETINGQATFTLPAASGTLYPTAMLLPYLAAGYFVVGGWGIG